MTEGPLELLIDPAPLSVHRTPLSAVSFVTVAVMPTGKLTSVAWDCEGERLTEIGSEGLEHPPGTSTKATVHPAQNEPDINVRMCHELSQTDTHLDISK